MGSVLFVVCDGVSVLLETPARTCNPTGVTVYACTCVCTGSRVGPKTTGGTGKGSHLGTSLVMPTSEAETNNGLRF